MFWSFFIFGCLPIIGYIASDTIIPKVTGHAASADAQFAAAIAVTCVVLFILGSLKSQFSSQKFFASGCETLLLGGICATISFFVAKFTGE